MAARRRLVILFNNADVTLPGNVESITMDTWDHELGVRAKGVFPG